MSLIEIIQDEKVGGNHDNKELCNQKQAKQCQQSIQGRLVEHDSKRTDHDTDGINMEGRARARAIE